MSSSVNGGISEQAAKTNGEGHRRKKPYKTDLKQFPVTLEREPYVPAESDPLVDPGTARANVAPTKESPNGTTDPEWVARNKNMTVIVQHSAYWDRSHTGVITPLDTYVGCRDYGWNVILSFIATVIINGGLSYPTCPTILPDPFFRLYLKNMHKAKHGSDSGSYDNEGRFRPQNFEDFFSKYDTGHKGGLSKADLYRAWKGQSLMFDFFGWAASCLEWVAVYLLIMPADGILRKEDVRAVFDGSYFYKAAEETKRRRARTGSKEYLWRSY